VKEKIARLGSGAEPIEKQHACKREGAQKMLECRKKFANPYVAAERGWVDVIIKPKKHVPSLSRLRALRR